jgi:hypothetical protein
MERAKDPERVRTGRLGGLTVAARGRTNVGPARAAWEARVADEFGIGEELAPAEHKRRMDAALRVRMARLARVRWGNRKAGSESQSPDPAVREGTSDAQTAA